MCDVPKLAGLIGPREDDAAFIALAHLRTAAEILDAQDLILIPAFSPIGWFLPEFHRKRG
jgi:hypothetical protein